MSNTVISIENLSKSYQLGTINTGTFYGDLNRWWARLRGLPDPHLKIGEKDHGNRDGETLWALKDINFQVQQGEALGIIGRNGAGKSTLLKILSRVTAPTSGEVKVKGRIASLLEVGTGFHPELTGRENIYLNGAIMGMDKSEITRKFDEIVDFSGVEKFIDTPVKRYSSGMYVRLAFAVAAHLDPEILIVDEVLAVGDAEFQKKCLGKMSDVAHEGRTVLFVSHNMSAIQRLCPKAFYMKRGRMIESGNSADIVGKYLSLDNALGSGVYVFEDTKKYDVQFFRVEMLNSLGTPVSLFNANEPIHFRITYRIARELSGATLGINIRNALGESLWAASDLDFYPELFDMRRPGVYVYDCIAPANVLRPGTYQVALGAATNAEYFHHPLPSSFEISTVGYWRTSFKFFGVINGGPITVPMKATPPILVEMV